MVDRLILIRHGRYFPLDNLAPYKVRHWGKLWPTAFHAYHGRKFQGNNVMIEDVRLACSPESVWELLMNRRSKITKLEPDRRLVIMKDILRQKLKTHYVIEELLLSTGDDLITESDYHESLWGLGDEDMGDNILGRLWMEIRDEIRQQKEE